MEKKAEIFAIMAHESIEQLRKYTLEKYIVHPKNVAYLVKIIGGTQEMISAAFLHDVIEDVFPENNYFNLKRIENNFGKIVSQYVNFLTNSTKLEDGNRVIRKKIELERISCAPAEVKTIKLADLIDNSLTITEYDPEFSKIYLPEKRALLNVLREGDKTLWEMANNILIRNGY